MANGNPLYPNGPKQELGNVDVSKAVGQAGQQEPEKEEFLKTHGDHLINIANSLNIKPADFDSWLNSRPRSENVQDRRGHQSNAQWLAEVLSDEMRLEGKPGERTIRKPPKDTTYVEGLGYPYEFIDPTRKSRME